MTRAATALLAGLALAMGIAACGGSDSETADVVPKSTPDLVAPRDTSLPEVAANTSTSTTSTTTTATTPVTPSSGTAEPSTGTGAATGGGTTGDTGGTSGGTSSGTGSGGGTSTSGGFGGFCTQNPGAC